MAKEVIFQIPQVEQGISPEAAFKRYTDIGITNALSVIHTDLETRDPDRPDRAFAFHTQPHTIGVINRATRLARAVQGVYVDPPLLTERDVQLIRLEAAYHDPIQESETQEVGGARKQLRSRSFENEENSARLAIAYMQRANEDRRQQGLPDVYTEADMARMWQIASTIAGWDVTNRTVEQPNYNTSTLDGKILALADLGGAGMDDGVAQYEMATLFQEDNVDYREYRERLSAAGPRRQADIRDSALEERLYDRLMAPDTGWIDAQIAFITGREKRLLGDMENFSADEAVRDAVRSEFSAVRFIRARDDLRRLKEALTSLPFHEWSGRLDEIIATVPEAFKELQEK